MNKINKSKNLAFPTQGRFVKNNGFTIIEVALVLAIAGLIFLVVFLALPALQNSQKDTARKQDVGRVVSALQSYAADHNGVLPVPADGADMEQYPYDGSNTSDDFGGYLGKLSSETKGVMLSSASRSADVGWMGSGSYWIEIFPNRLCPGNGTATTSDAQVGVLLSSGKIYCADM